jgi:putative ABC transport system permease protein
MIRFETVVELIKANVTHRLLRTLLTLLGIIVGVASVFCLVTVGQGLEDRVRGEFADVGTNRLLVEPQGSDATLDDDDVDAVEAVNGLGRVVPLGASASQVSWGDESVAARIVGLPGGDRGRFARQTLGSELQEGRSLGDNEVGAAVVGHDYRYGESFTERRRIGQDITVRGDDFEIVGVQEELGTTIDDRLVFIPTEEYQALFDDETYQYIIVETPEGAALEPFVEDIERSLRDERDEDVGDETFSVQTVQDLVDSFTGILGAVQIVVTSIAAISLLVGAIGVGNTMYTAVLERRRDIGVLKSIGAGRTDILLIFASEAGFLGLVGGVIGVGVGVGLTELIVYAGSFALPAQFIGASYSPSLFITAILGSAALGIVAGAIPAYRASRLDPVDALRTE